MKISTLLFLLSPILLHASFLRVPFEGIRQTGMGNAFVAVADDKHALFYNPAALARMKQVHFDLFDLSLGVDSNDTLQRIKNATFNGEWAGLLRPDRAQYLRFTVNPTFYAPYFGVGFYENFQSFLEISSVNILPGIDIPQIDTFGANDLGVITGVGIPLGDYLSVGVSFRLLHRTAIDTTITLQDILAQLGLTETDFYGAIYRQLSRTTGTGYGVAANVSTLMQIPLGPKAPIFKLGATLEDVGRTTFRGIAGAPPPPSIPMTANIGTAVTYAMAKNNEFNLALDIRQILNAQPVAKMLHLGLEYKGPIVSLRTGLYEGYPTFGFTFRALPHTRVNFSTYSKELGSDWWQKEMRLYFIQLVIGFNPI